MNCFDWLEHAILSSWDSPVYFLIDLLWLTRACCPFFWTLLGWLGVSVNQINIKLLLGPAGFVWISEFSFSFAPNMTWLEFKTFKIRSFHFGLLYQFITSYDRFYAFKCQEFDALSLLGLMFSSLKKIITLFSLLENLKKS